jgi:tetratricopeptide (TPR) repeat protein
VGGLLVYQSWRQTRELAAHYQWGIAALQSGDYAIALPELAWVVEQSPDYQDAPDQLAVAQAQADQAGLYAQARAYCDQQQWELAIAALESLSEQAPDYEPEQVTDLLFTAHSQAGLKLADEGQFSQAVRHFDEALALQPDAEVERQTRLAALYPQGLAALDRGQCSNAAETLREVYALDPAYQQVADRLYAATTCYCAALSEKGRLDQAEAECQAALQIKPGGEEALAGLARIASLRTPTPTPRQKHPSPSPRSLRRRQLPAVKPSSFASLQMPGATPCTCSGSVTPWAGRSPAGPVP